MSLGLRCPSCQKKMSVPDHAIGRRVQCPRCVYVFRYTGQREITLGRVRQHAVAVAAPIAPEMLVEPDLTTFEADLHEMPAPAAAHALAEEIGTMPVIDLPEMPQALLDQLKLPIHKEEPELIEESGESLDIEMVHSSPADAALPEITEAEIEALFLDGEGDLDAAKSEHDSTPETQPNLELPPVETVPELAEVDDITIVEEDTPEAFDAVEAIDLDVVEEIAGAHDEAAHDANAVTSGIGEVKDPELRLESAELDLVDVHIPEIDAVEPAPADEEILDVVEEVSDFHAEAVEEIAEEPIDFMAIDAVETPAEPAGGAEVSELFETGVKPLSAAAAELELAEPAFELEPGAELELVDEAEPAPETDAEQKPSNRLQAAAARQFGEVDFATDPDLQINPEYFHAEPVAAESVEHAPPAAAPLAAPILAARVVTPTAGAVAQALPVGAVAKAGVILAAPVAAGVPMAGVIRAEPVAPMQTDDAPIAPPTPPAKSPMGDLDLDALFEKVLSDSDKPTESDALPVEAADIDMADFEVAGVEEVSEVEAADLDEVMEVEEVAEVEPLAVDALPAVHNVIPEVQELAPLEGDEPLEIVEDIHELDAELAGEQEMVHEVAVDEEPVEVLEMVDEENLDLSTLFKDIDVPTLAADAEPVEPADVVEFHFEDEPPTKPKK